MLLVWCGRYGGVTEVLGLPLNKRRWGFLGFFCHKDKNWTYSKLGLDSPGYCTVLHSLLVCSDTEQTAQSTLYRCHDSWSRCRYRENTKYITSTTGIALTKGKGHKTSTLRSSPFITVKLSSED